MLVFSLLKPKNETLPGFREFKWMFLELPMGLEEKERESEEREGREKDEGQESNATLEAEMSVCEVLRVCE